MRPYGRPPLSKEGLLGPVDPSFRPEGWYREQGVELRLGAAAVALDPARRIVTLDDGDRLGYDALLIATGARPRALATVPRALLLRHGSMANDCVKPCWAAVRWPSRAPG